MIHRLVKFGDAVCTAVIVVFALYFAAHVITAWLRGSFEVTR